MTWSHQQELANDRSIDCLLYTCNYFLTCNKFSCNTGSVLFHSVPFCSILFRSVPEHSSNISERSNFQSSYKELLLLKVVWLDYVFDLWLKTLWSIVIRPRLSSVCACSIASYLESCVKLKCKYSHGLALVIYRIAGKFGGDFNLAVWRIAKTSPNLNPR